jgi:PAS domain-containing protein
MDRRDIGRPVGAIDAFLGVGVEDRVRTVLEQLTGSEEELQGANGRWYSLRIAPYRTVDHAIRGAVIVLADIDVRRSAEELTRDVRRYAVRFLAAIDQPLLILDLDLRIVWANERFLRTFDLEEEETVGTPLEALSDRQLASRTLLDEIEKLRSDPSRPLRRLELPVRTPGKPERTIRVAGSVIPAAGDVSRLLLLSFDIKQGAPVAGREVVEHEQDS